MAQLRAAGFPNRAKAMARRKKTTAKPKATGAFAKKVKAVLAKQSETKYVSDNYDKNSNRALDPVWTLNDIGAGVLKFLPMLPRTSQGVGTFNRIGDVIQPVGKVATTLEFSLSGEDLSGHQIKVEIWYGTSKSRKDWAQNPLPTDNFLDQGNGTNTNPSTARTSTMLPADHNLVSFKKKVFILSKTPGTIGGDNGDGNFASNGGKSYRSIKLLHTPPKKLKYALAADNYPDNYAPGYYINLSYVDGEQPQTTAYLQNMVNITSRTHLHFKDM